MAHYFDFSVPDSGRLFVRNMSHGRAMAGVLHFDKSVQIEEEKPYILMMKDGAVLVSRESVGGPPSMVDPHDGDYVLSVDEALRAPLWQKTTDKDTLVVRFLKAFPEDNGWAVFGPSHLRSESKNSSDWWDVSMGRMTSVDAPANDMGYTMSQVLSTLPVWPSKDGELFAVPSLPSRTDEIYERLHAVMGTAGATEATLRCASDLIRAVPGSSSVAPRTVDDDFCRFLHASGTHLLDKKAPNSKPYSTKSIKELFDGEEKASEALKKSNEQRRMPEDENKFTLEKLEDPIFETWSEKYKSFFVVCLMVETMEKIASQRKRKVSEETDGDLEKILTHEKVWGLLRGRNDDLSVLVPMCFLSDRPDILRRVLENYNWASRQDPNVLTHWFDLSLSDRYKSSECSAVLAESWSGDQAHQIKCQNKILVSPRLDIAEVMTTKKTWLDNPAQNNRLLLAVMRGARGWSTCLETMNTWIQNVPSLKSTLSFGSGVVDYIATSSQPLEKEHAEAFLDLGLDLDAKKEMDTGQTLAEYLSQSKNKNTETLLSCHTHRVLTKHMPEKKKAPIKKM